MEPHLCQEDRWRFEAHLVALSCSEPPEVCAVVFEAISDKVVELSTLTAFHMKRASNFKKTRSAMATQRMGIPPNQNGRFVANMENDIGMFYKRPFDFSSSGCIAWTISKQLISETRVPIAVSPGGLPNMTMNTNAAAYPIFHCM